MRRMRVGHFKEILACQCTAVCILQKIVYHYTPIYGVMKKNLVKHFMMGVAYCVDSSKNGNNFYYFTARNKSYALDT